MFNLIQNYSFKLLKNIYIQFYKYDKNHYKKYFLMSTTAPSSLVISATLKDYINRELINFKINVSQFKLKHCILLKMSIILDGHK